jgi:FixJ family two-component response regulator
MDQHREQRVYVIDGDPAVRDGLATLIGIHDHTVLAYATAGDFLRAVGGAVVDCVICELGLPDMSGLDVFRTLHERHPHMRFALLVSRKDPLVAQRARDLGIRHVFQKPLVHRELLAFVSAS